MISCVAFQSTALPQLPKGALCCYQGDKQEELGRQGFAWKRVSELFGGKSFLEDEQKCFKKSCLALSCPSTTVKK